MAEVLDDSKLLGILVTQPVVEPGKFELVAYSITPVSASPGDKFSAEITMKNIGGEMAECRGKLVEHNTNKIIDKEPDASYEDVEPGESWTVILSDFLWSVPDIEGLWKLRVEAWRQV